MSGDDANAKRAPMWDQDGVHEIYRSWRKLLDSYPGDRVLVAEAWVSPVERLVRYIRSDEMHQAFNFQYLQSAWRAEDLRAIITQSLQAAGSVGAPTTWVLSNHDVIRHASRFGYPAGTVLPHGIGIPDPQPDRELGLRRARAATLLMLGLPGSAYLYQGEELGLPEDVWLPDAARQDPTWLRSAHQARGRDGCRVPIPWAADAPSFGFGPTESSWLPQPDIWAQYALDRQHGVAGSTYELYPRGPAAAPGTRAGPGHPVLGYGARRRGRVPQRADRHPRLRQPVRPAGRAAGGYPADPVQRAAGAGWPGTAGCHRVGRRLIGPQSATPRRYGMSSMTPK